ncbi:ATP13A1 [Acrasis kona]|uniref:ATP13A1 n=1 Tax=Acrasis kona TaxID=1008807 RepID=A0AAW2ZDY5_9EUKA
MCGTHDFMVRSGLLLGVIRTHNKGREITVKSFEVCYSEAQYHQIICDHKNKVKGKSVVVGWFRVSKEPMDYSSIKDMFQYMQYMITRRNLEEKDKETSGYLRELFISQIGLTITKSETKEKNEQLDILKTTTQAHSVQPYFSLPMTPIVKKMVLTPNNGSGEKNHLVYNVNEDPSPLLPDQSYLSFIRPERFSVLELRQDINLVIHTGQMSELYETNLSWQNDSQFCCELDEKLLESDLKQCMLEISNNGSITEKMETFTDEQLKKNEVHLEEYEKEYKDNLMLMLELSHCIEKIESIERHLKESNSNKNQTV